MNPELVEKITRMIVEKLESSQTNGLEQTGPAVTFWSQSKTSEEEGKTSHPARGSSNSAGESSHPARGSSNPARETSNPERAEKRAALDGKVKIWEHAKKENRHGMRKGERSYNSNSRLANRIAEIKEPFDGEELKRLKSKTPARIGVGRSGPRPRTNTLLKFRFDHAAAVDAVYGEVNKELLESLNLFTVNTRVTEKDTYIRRPDYGRKLSDEAIREISQKCKKSPTVQIIVSDGLSSKAIDENLEDVYLSFQQSLQSMGLETGTPFYIEKGRVAVMDDVGEILKPKVIVLLIGERPGLVSAESLSAYLCYEPRRGTIEADRMVISNIHRGGIPPVEAGAYLGTVIQKVLKYEASGVSLVNKEE
ncbi:ethanolamine ammonia-lyase subunit EutC [Bacillus sp. REN3]|uniref:ethanolamine ammonia-lyase subunit EutC n=1 Tax=Bacillus sp. REN3 TaxID=2802440 RepID=UPI001AEDA435|nr:ethanolamine ammonia-lyase subunit EutC [Bacillus sp. REN3]